jgi:hypothetical protein
MNQITHLCGYATAHAGCAALGFASHSGAIAMTLAPGINLVIVEPDYFRIADNAGIDQSNDPKRAYRF